MERNIPHMSTAQKKIKAILHLVPQAKFTAVNDEITWLDDREQPTEEQILEVLKNLDALEKEQDVRRKRNALLASTDWTVLPDSPLTSEKQAEYVVYRQALRDVTSIAGFPNVDFPEDPNTTSIPADREQVVLNAEVKSAKELADSNEYKIN